MTETGEKRRRLASLIHDGSVAGYPALALPLTA